MKSVSFHASDDPVALLEAFGKGEAEAARLSLDGRELCLKRAFRYLPGHRLTALADWGDGQVVVKCFYGDRHQRDFERETGGLEWLEQAGIPTPRQLAQAVQDDGGLCLLVLEYLVDSMTLKQALSGDEAGQPATAWLEQAAETFARLHQADLLQPDPHLDNFLCQNRRLFMIDAGQVSRSKKPLTWDQALQNLALLFAQLPVGRDDDGYQALQAYLSWFDRAPGELDRITWDEALLRQRRWREKRFIDKKVFRDCTAFVRESSRGVVRMLARPQLHSELHQRLLDPQACFANAAGEQVQLVTRAGETYRMQRFPGSAWHHALRESAAARAWRNGHLLRLLGIPTLQPLGLVEQRFGPLRGTSYLLTGWGDAADLSEVLNRPGLAESEVRNLAEQVRELLNSLRRCQLMHRNLDGSALAVVDGECRLTGLEHLTHTSSEQAATAGMQHAARALLADLKRTTDHSGPFASLVD